MFKRRMSRFMEKILEYYVDTLKKFSIKNFEKSFNNLQKARNVFICTYINLYSRNVHVRFGMRDLAHMMHEYLQLSP